MAKQKFNLEGVDLANPIRVDWDDTRLQAFLIFSVVVAGKNSAVFDQKVRAFLAPAFDREVLPFEYLAELKAAGKLRQRIEEFKLGNYTKHTRCFEAFAEGKIDVRCCTLADLEAIEGISFKTSRFWMMYVRPGMEVAALDTHILWWMRQLGYRVPKSTPSGGRRADGTRNSWLYRAIELLFIEEAKARGLTPTELDYHIWMWRARGQEWVDPLEGKAAASAEPHTAVQHKIQEIKHAKPCTAAASPEGLAA